MSLKVAIVDEDGTSKNGNLNRFPDKCPVCGTQGQPSFRYGALKGSRGNLIFQCPTFACRSLYIGNYLVAFPTPATFNASLNGCSFPYFFEPHAFPPNIEAISPESCKIFNQALTAEKNQLDLICGPGYRKSLEFLIKDFLVNRKYKGDEKKKEEIKSAFLGTVIKSHIDDPLIKKCAERAVWLGNDETHYVRRWSEKDIGDLKSLIQITVNFIDSCIEAERYEAEMPAAK